MQEIDLKPDCGACAALCCVMLPFDQGAAFAFDKAGAEACRHLVGHGCGIHARLEVEGFSGCVRFDCQGAGQRVVQEVVGGRSGRDDPALMAPLEAAFRAMRRLHEDYGVLVAAKALALTETEEAVRLGLLKRVDAGATQTEASITAYEAGKLPEAIVAFVAGLKRRLRPGR